MPLPFAVAGSARDRRSVRRIGRHANGHVESDRRVPPSAAEMESRLPEQDDDFDQRVDSPGAGDVSFAALRLRRACVTKPRIFAPADSQARMKEA